MWGIRGFIKAASSGRVGSILVHVVSAYSPAEFRRNMFQHTESQFRAARIIVGVGAFACANVGREIIVVD